MRNQPVDERRPIFRDEPDGGDAADELDPDIVPDDAARGGVTVPSTNQTGTTTPPISGWGETLEGEERAPEPKDETRE